jgi:uncharacterized protein RhaS with RHS repeats
LGGLFTQEDPIGLAGGLNLYGYANGDPINFRDPFGLDPCRRVRGEKLREECRERTKREREREKSEEEKQLDEDFQGCVAGIAEFAARGTVDIGLGLLYSSGLGALTRGAVLLAEGGAISNGLILTATVGGAGSTGAVELAAGTTLFTSGGAALGFSSTAAGPGLSSVPGGNTYSFLREGGFAGCGRVRSAIGGG